MNKLLNYLEIISWLRQKGIELYGKNFKIIESDHQMIYKLIAYFLRDEIICYQLNIDLDKGILLSGPIGCGKTTLMNLMKLTPSEHKFFIKPCRDISYEFIQKGYEIIKKYSKGKLYPDPKTICFDDLGTENNLKYFGNECNVMAEIILSRYDIIITKKIRTQITSNLSASEIEMLYGNRLRSRM